MTTQNNFPEILKRYNYRGHIIQITPNRDAFTAIIYDESGNPIGASFATPKDELSIEEKAELKVNLYCSALELYEGTGRD